MQIPKFQSGKVSWLYIFPLFASNYQYFDNLWIIQLRYNLLQLINLNLNVVLA